MTDLSGNPVIQGGTDATDIGNVSDSLKVSATPRGFSTVSIDTSIAVTSASTLLLAANANRRYAYFMNQSGGTVYLRFGSAAAVSRGITLAAGSLYQMNADNLWLGDVNAIRSGGGSFSIDVFEATL